MNEVQSEIIAKEQERFESWLFNVYGPEFSRQKVGQTYTYPNTRKMWSAWVTAIYGLDKYATPTI